VKISKLIEQIEIREEKEDFDVFFSIDPELDRLEKEWHQKQSIAVKMFNDNKIKKMVYDSDLLKDKSFDPIVKRLNQRVANSTIESMIEMAKARIAYEDNLIKLIKEKRAEYSDDEFEAKFGVDKWNALLKDAPWNKTK
jgi:hypothetical protein